jgi:DNA-binding beta-propeller fold protein YncE
VPISAVLRAALGCAALLAVLASPPVASAIQTGRPLYVTHRNSNDVSMFGIGATGALTSLGHPVATGAAPRGVVFAPDGRSAYVANGSGDTVSAYTVGAGGQLSELHNPVPTEDEPFGIAMAPNGRTVYVANHGSDTVSAFAVDRRGALTSLGPVRSGASSPKGVAVTPDGRHLYVAHGLPTDTDPDFVTMFDVHRDGSLTLRARTPIGESGQGVAISPDGRFLYVACQGSDEVFGFKIGRDGGLEPVPGSPVSVPRFAESPVVTPDSRALYVGSVGQAPDRIRAVSAFTIGTDGGLELVPGSPFQAGLAPAGVIPTPDGRRLYVGNFTSNEVSGFDIGSDGVLTQVAGSPFPSGGDAPSFQGIAVLPNQGPTASFSAGGHGVVRFDATGSSDADGRVARYDWDFGDGTGLRDGGATPSHVYRRRGSFRVTLTVTDDEGCATGLVFTGQSPLCGGSRAATAMRRVFVSRAR